MRVDRVVRDSDKTLRQVLAGLDHNLTARDNFGPEGESGWVLTSRGPNQTPVYGPVTITTETEIDWSSISGTPNTLAGYGIEDAYTTLQVNNLLEAQTHDASDIISGILTTPRLGAGVSGSGTYLRGDSTWQPLSLSGLGIASEVAGIAAAAALKEVEGYDDWPAMIPGPRGDTGVAGAAGPAGVGTNIQLFVEEYYDEYVTVPGPIGAVGAPGGVGPAGTGTNIQMILEEHYDEYPTVPGPTGNIGPTGLTGPAVIQLVDEEYYEEYTTVPGPAGNLGTTGAQGPAGTFQYSEEYYNDEYTVPGPQGSQGAQGSPGSIIVFEEYIGDDWQLMIPGPAGATGPAGAPGSGGGGGTSILLLPGWEDQANEDAMMYAGSGVLGQGTPGRVPIWVNAGQLRDSVWGAVTGHLLPATDSAYDIGAIASKVKDLYFGGILSQGTNLTTFSPGAGPTLEVGGGSAWTAVSFFTGGVGRWRINSAGHFVAVTDNSFDIGATVATRPRTIYVGTQLILEGAAPALRFTNSVANAAIATTLGSTGPTGSTAGAPRGWVPVSIAGVTRYIPFW